MRKWRKGLQAVAIQLPRHVVHGGPLQHRRRHIRAAAYELGSEHLRRLVDEAAFARDADGGEWVVTGDHAAGEVGAAEGLNGWCRAGLELVLEDD